MKFNVLATMVAGALLTACGGSGGSSDPANDPFTAQAYDPAVYLMDFSHKCGDATGFTASGKTDFEGNAVTAAIADPADCEFKFEGGDDAVDVTNGKSMTGVTYLVPKGLAVAGEPLTGSPLTSAIYAALDGADYDESTASTVLEALGLGDIINAGTSISDLLLNTESVADDLGDEAKTQLLATTAVLSDVLTNSPDASIDEITTATETAYESIADTYVIGDVVEVAADGSVEVTEGTPVENPDETPTGTGTGSGSSTSGS